MVNGPLQFSVVSVRIGLVHDITSQNGFNRGTLVLDDETSEESVKIKALVSLAGQVDVAWGNVYLEAWHTWRQSCDATQAAGGFIGSTERPVGEFSIDSDWLIEWADAESGSFPIDE